MVTGIGMTTGFVPLYERDTNDLSRNKPFSQFYRTPLHK